MTTTTTTTASLLEQIRDYTNVGIYSLIPLKHGTKNKPLVDWKPYRKRLPTPSERASWFSSPSKLCNVAAVLGRTARLVAIDIDGDAAKQRVERKLVEMGRCNNLRVSILHTMMTRTGSGGFHFVFRISDPELSEKYDLRTKTLWQGSPGKHEEIKFLGEGSIAMLAPSLHPNGSGQYLWNGKPPMELSEKELKQLLEVFCERYLPTSLDEHITTNTAVDNSIKQSLLLQNTHSSLSPNETQQLITALKPVYKLGKRNTITMGYSGFMRKHGYTLRVVEDFCVLVCRTFNDEEIESRLRTVRDTFRKPIDKIAGWSLLNDIS